MAFLTMLLTIPLLYIALEKKNSEEDFLKLKLFCIWLLCQTYILLNHRYRIPLGILICLIIVLNNKVNNQSKLTAFLVGILGFGTSIGVNILYSL